MHEILYLWTRKLTYDWPVEKLERRHRSQLMISVHITRVIFCLGIIFIILKLCLEYLTHCNLCICFYCEYLSTSYQSGALLMVKGQHKWESCPHGIYHTCAQKVIFENFKQHFVSCLCSKKKQRFLSICYLIFITHSIPKARRNYSLLTGHY